MAIHPLLLMDKFIDGGNREVGGSSPNKHRGNRLYVHQKYGMETKRTNDLGRYRRQIRPSTAVDGSPWRLRELVEMG
jgi:hypothetical protein